MGLHEYIRRIWNRFPEYNMCEHLCALAMYNVHCTYLYPLKSIKNGSYLWQNVCLFYHFGQICIEKVNPHA